MAAPMKVELGFLETTESFKLKSKFFPSKIGGKPAWLNLRDLPCETDVECQMCGKPLTFLLQIYAPVTEREDCFHRTIFLFFCENPECCQPNEAKNFAAFRCQLPRMNEFYSNEPPIENGDDPKPTASDFVNLCFVCGGRGDKKCARCSTPYCSKAHQILDWKVGHKELCKSRALCTEDSDDANRRFAEYEIITEQECETEEREETNDQKEMREDDVNALSLKDLDDLEEMASSRSDKQFSKFRKRIALDPQQVLRYQRSGSPLWVSNTSMLSCPNVPKCDECGATRHFEFQILPQLLNHLKLDRVGASVDWGTVVVYTCSENCSSSTKAYLKEFVYKQDFSHEQI